MIKHLFKLIWNKKKQNLLLTIEMLCSFLVLFAVFSLMVYYFDNYKRPMGFEYEHVWVINYDNPLKTSNNDSIARFYENVRQTLKAMPQVSDLSFTSFYQPFSEGVSETVVSDHQLKAEHVAYISVEDSYKDVLQLKLLEGRWFNRTDVVSTHNSIVIDSSLKAYFFGNSAGVGRVLGDQKVVGVVEDPKLKGDYSSLGYALFNRADTVDFPGMNSILVKVSPQADAAFEGRLYKILSVLMNSSHVEIEHLSDKRRVTNKLYLTPIIITTIVATFLIVNVALGLFGVLWYNINKRKSEIGLRRAVGASGWAVSVQLVGEAMIIATFALVIGSFFAVQVPLLNLFSIGSQVYVKALILDILFIYGLVFICSLYPGKQAAAIYPAVALHED